MAEPKTKSNNRSVEAFLKEVPAERRQDCRAVSALMEQVTGAKPKMWGTNIVGFGTYHYRYASGREGDWPLIGFSPRKQNLTIYLMGGFDEPLLEKLGRHKTGKACLYIRSLDDVDTKVLRQLVEKSVKRLEKRAR